MQVPALERGLAVIELLASSQFGMTLAEINGVLGISGASVFRIAAALEELGYVHREAASKRYALTRKLLLLGQPRTGGISLVESALDPMRRTLAQTGETTQLCCLAEEECVVLEQLPSTHPFKYIVDLGSRPPIYSSAPGKAMLAFLPERELQATVRKIKLVRHTARTLASRSALLAELEVIRGQGYAVDCGEQFEAIHCVAAPILDRHGLPIAALTIAGPAERIPQAKFAGIGRLMIAAANDAARRFENGGFSGGNQG